MKKLPGCDFDNSPPRSVEFKSEWSYTSVPSVCLHGVDGENLLLSYIMFIKNHTNATCVNLKIIGADRFRSPEGSVPY